MSVPDDAILYYDGECGFCSSVVQFVLRHERRHSLRFATLQGARAAELLGRHPRLRSIDTVILHIPGSPERVLVKSAAALAVGRYLGGIWGAFATIGSLVPRFVRDWSYDIIARYRKRLVPMNTSCLVPTLEQKARFLD